MQVTQSSAASLNDLTYRLSFNLPSKATLGKKQGVILFSLAFSPQVTHTENMIHLLSCCYRPVVEFMSDAEAAAHRSIPANT